MFRARYTADPLAVSGAVLPCRSDDQEVPQAISSLPPFELRFSIFIDGTMNNLFNTHSRRQRDTGTSSSNDYSNVARMAMNITGASESFHQHMTIYVEGMGTFHAQHDRWSTDGAAFGIGHSGIISRVNLCFQKLCDFIIAFSNTNISRYRKELLKLHLDIFGFSRGAASARSFVHRMNGFLPDRIMNMTDFDNYTFGMKLSHYSNRQIIYSHNNFRFHFVGLFDTVSSHGTDHDDVSDLGLSLDSNLSRIDKVVHLVASDEHRKNFSLTSIASAGEQKGITIFMPGVHSDIGGGYADNYSEDLTLWKTTNILPAENEGNKFNQERNSFISLGWFSRRQLEGSLINQITLIGRRNEISNTYSYIGLLLMVDYAKQNQLIFDENAIHERLLNENEDLIWIKREIENNRDRTTNEWINFPGEQMARIRGRYFHFSSSIGVVNHPNFCIGEDNYGTSNNHLINGTRKRKVYAG
jgi:hypothetical protein